MKFPFARGKQKRDCQSIGLWLGSDEIVCDGYTSLDKVPEIMTACRRIAELIGSMTIYLMSNTAKGDVRVVNELSRAIDVNPTTYMTRSMWMQAIVMNLLLYGKGNSIVFPHTENGYLRDLEPIAASRVSFTETGYSKYQVVIDGIPYSPDDVLHFTYNPDKLYLWKGRGVNISLRDLAMNLCQATKTEKAFMASEYKPSIIVKVDAMTEEFSSPAGRQKLIDSYVKPSRTGEPWVIPAEQFSVEQVKPLTLADLAIKDTVEMDKRAVAAVLGVPPFLLGVGNYDKNAWNSFIQNTIRPLALSIQQELTKKLILSPKMYLKFNTLSLMDWDIKEIASVFGSLSDRGFVTGNEVRDRIGLSPMDELDELRILENYIGWEYSNAQKKLKQEDE